MTSVRTVLSIAAQKNYHVHQMDVSVAFPNANLEEEIYCKMPDGYKEYNDNGTEKVLKLKRALYGLKQSPRQWNKLLKDHLQSECGLVQSKNDDCIFIKPGGDYLVVAVYVDDIIIEVCLL